jgi:hypothetical protein
MVSSGEEKKIQTLFHELRLEDEQTAPRFAELLVREELRSTRTRTSLNFRFAAAVLIACLALFSLALLSRHWQHNPPSRTLLSNGPAEPAARQAQVADYPQPIPTSAPEHEHQVRKPRAARFGTRKYTTGSSGQPITRNVIAISRWQSPTAGLLHSQSDHLFKSLPQLNQTLRELESFLPNRLN